MIVMLTSILDRRVDDGETLLVLLEGHAGDAEHAAQFVVRYLHRAWRRCRTWRRLREGCRSRSMEGDVSFDFLHDLMDVAVEHGHRAEALEVAKRPRAVFRTPTPLRIDGPQWNVCEDDDRLR